MIIGPIFYFFMHILQDPSFSDGTPVPDPGTQNASDRC